MRMRRLRNMELTRRLYCFIRHYTHTYRLPPTQREMAEACFVSSGTVVRHLDRLEMLGYIERIENSKRAVTLTDKKPLDCDGEQFDPPRSLRHD